MPSFRSPIPCTIALCLTMLLSFLGYTQTKSRSNWVRLREVPVKSIEARLPSGARIAPGESLPLTVLVTTQDGKVLSTEGRDDTRVWWSDLAFESLMLDVNYVDHFGYVTLFSDARVSDGKTPHLTITVPGRVGVRAELDIPVHYDRSFVADFSGSYGTNGGPGGNAPDADVRVTLRPGARPLLQITLLSEGREKFYLVDPSGGSLTINSEGGRGGDGFGCPWGPPSYLPGPGGPQVPPDRPEDIRCDRGPQGRGGKITVTYDPQAKPYLNAIKLKVRKGPRPVFKEEAVALDWPPLLGNVTPPPARPYLLDFGKGESFHFERKPWTPHPSPSGDGARP